MNSIYFGMIVSMCVLATLLLMAKEITPEGLVFYGQEVAYEVPRSTCIQMH